ncbi:murein transglycosylase A [Actibacterium lipolyticum]|uniref:peptidoglycan lytic exotransglycosylase n=1 Tax=Actibacterium lipolyticum TaxID=1524263 RepID=A0A238KWH4_9RHOB|nr:murein transglycosylase A [Actibacterium lipolyticum]SMX47129.1 Membrane-bound lytic murein transglycosylase A precursor [Actibacterium lipolyticum]
MIRGLRAVAAAAALAVSGANFASGASAEILRFEDLDGWADDDHQAALSVFLETCADLKSPDWAPICSLAQSQPNARTFFELFFRPVLIGGEAPALFTGYFEPELNGALRPSARFRFPLYRKPPELQDGVQWNSRAEIENEGLLSDRGLEIAWVDDPVEVFFLQIQGSGRVRLPDGSALRVGYGGANGHKYRSIGAELVRRGIYERHQVSAQVIRNWVRRNPEAGRELLQHNPSYVFFREVGHVPAEKGPLGAMNRSITTLRTVAVDPAYTPLGAPVWIEKGGRGPLRRLMIAQDTGSAIKGAQRADIFFGTGDEAGRDAGRVRDPGRMVVLLPIEQAFDLVPEG